MAPLGAKGVGEPPCISVTPAIANAIAAATGRAREPGAGPAAGHRPAGPASPACRGSEAPLTGLFAHRRKDLPVERSQVGGSVHLHGVGRRGAGL